MNQETQILSSFTPSMPYVGRFAPSPSGPLHFGSLVTALASYLQAKSQNGQWLVRIEDIDPPREIAGASDIILRTLEAHGLQWDQSVSYQSRHSEHYEEALSLLAEKKLTYNCQCTRQMIKARGGQYDGFCRDRQLGLEGSSIRLRNDIRATLFDDVIQGHVSLDKLCADEDFVVKRKDKLYAYQLAVVVDDARQGITEVIRGCDLLRATFHQLCLFSALKETPPTYGHIPVVASSAGMKLSKQNKATAIENSRATDNVFDALMFLGLSPDVSMRDSAVDDVLQWAAENWHIAHIPATPEIIWKPR